VILTDSVHQRALKKSVEKLLFYVNKKNTIAFEKMEADPESQGRGSDGPRDPRSRFYARSALKRFLSSRDASFASASFIFSS
jgi:hypothetical protein